MNCKRNQHPERADQVQSDQDFVFSNGPLRQIRTYQGRKPAIQHMGNPAAESKMRMCMQQVSLLKKREVKSYLIAHHQAIERHNCQVKQPGPEPETKSVLCHLI